MYLTGEQLRKELVGIYNQMLAYAIYRTRDRDKGEDLVLKACMKILEREEKKPTAFTNVSKDFRLISYAIRTIQNLHIDRTRKEKKWRSGRIDDQGDETFEKKIEDILYQDEVLAALSRLSENCRDILMERATGGSYEEIAKTLKIAIGTVMSRMARCRKSLRMVLDGKMS